MYNALMKIKTTQRKASDPSRKKYSWLTAILMGICLVLFIGAWIYGRQPTALRSTNEEDAKSVYFSHVSLAGAANGYLFTGVPLPEAYADALDAVQYYDYEYGVVEEVLSESVTQDEETENVHIGSQLLKIRLLTGEYKGQTFETDNQMSKLFDKYSQKGTRLLLYVFTDESRGTASVSITIMNYDRSLILLLACLVFLAVALLVGGKIGARSLLGLALTLLCVTMVLVPLLLKGFSPIPLTLCLCIYVTVVCFLLLGGVSKKTVSAILGTVTGFILAALFAELFGKLCRLDGLQYNVSETDTLLQAKFQGQPIQMRGLFTAGVIIASLGAVMDVAMSISSAVSELKRVNPNMNARALLSSGMHIGRDAVGTMTNTLILAFTGGALVELLLIYINNWDVKAILSNDYMTGEIITGLAGSVGLILAVPATALIAACLFGGGSVLKQRFKGGKPQKQQ